MLGLINQKKLGNIVSSYNNDAHASNEIDELINGLFDCLQNNDREAFKEKFKRILQEMKKDEQNNPIGP